MKDMNLREKINPEDVVVEDGAISSEQHDCSIAVIEYPEGYEEGEELDLEVWYEGADYKIPSNALRVAAQLLEIAESKGLINT